MLDITSCFLPVNNKHMLTKSFFYLEKLNLNIQKMKQAVRPVVD